MPDHAAEHANQRVVVCQTVLLNMLTSEFFLLENPLEDEPVLDALLSDTRCIIHGTKYTLNLIYFGALYFAV